MSPIDSDDLTEISAPLEHAIALLKSPPSAGHSPDYQIVAVFEMPPEVMRNWR